MKCHQCDRPALYLMGEQKIPLCVECNHKVDSAAYMQFLMNAAMMNQAADDMDMVAGFSVGGGRIPVADMARAMQGPATYNNFRISNSTVGVLNTGDLARIDAVITLTKDTDAEAVGQQLRMLTEAVANSREMENSVKKEMIDLVQALADQVVGARGERKPSVVLALLKSIEERAVGFVAISQVVSMLVSAISAVFGGG
jgi:hypothetical protein